MVCVDDLKENIERSKKIVVFLYSQDAGSTLVSLAIKADIEMAEEAISKNDEGLMALALFRLDTYCTEFEFVDYIEA